MPPLSALQRSSNGPTKEAESARMSRGLPTARAAMSDCQPPSVPPIVYSSRPRSPDWNTTLDALGPITMFGRTNEAPHHPTCNAQLTFRSGVSACKYWPSKRCAPGSICTPIASNSPRKSSPAPRNNSIGIAHSRQCPSVFLNRISRPKLLSAASNVTASTCKGEQTHCSESVEGASSFLPGLMLKCQTPGRNFLPSAVSSQTSKVRKQGRS